MFHQYWSKPVTHSPVITLNNNVPALTCKELKDLKFMNFVSKRFDDLPVITVPSQGPNDLEVLNLASKRLDDLPVITVPPKRPTDSEVTNLMSKRHNHLDIINLTSDDEKVPTLGSKRSIDWDQIARASQRPNDVEILTPVSKRPAGVQEIVPASKRPRNFLILECVPDDFVDKM